MVDEKLMETIRQGLQDELSAVVNYSQIAAEQGDMALKKVFLNYAMEEMGHAQKLLALMESIGAEAGQLNLNLFPEDDLLVGMVEYLAREESAVFYYEVLEKLHEDESVKMICRQIKQEEQRHYKHIQGILQGIKTGEYHYD